jgi:hypothetical protein
LEVPELFSLVFCQQRIEKISSFCVAKGLISRIEVEENYTKCEKVNNMALIWTLNQDFWCHVASSADPSSVEP